VALAGDTATVTGTDAAVDGAAPRPRDLRVEYEADPSNVPPERPRFSWRVAPTRRGHAQTAYRVRVGRDRWELDGGDATVWDSGRVESGRSTGVPYHGSPLEADTTYYWTVRVWDEDGAATDADPAAFTTARPPAGSWDAAWITHQPDGGDANGFRTPWRRPEDADDAAWVQVDLGEPVGIDEIVLHPATPFDGPTTPDGTTVSSLYAAGEDLAHPITARGAVGFGFPRRYRVEAADDPSFEAPTVVADRTRESQHNPGDDAVRLSADVTARFVRVVATERYRVDPDDTPQGFAAVDDRLGEDHRPWTVFALAAIAVYDDRSGADRARGRTVSASASVEDETWSVAALVDGRETSTVAATAPRLRTEFELSGAVERARAHVAGLGYGELYVNGDRVGDRTLDPAWTAYDETVLYTTHDLTDRLQPGTNAVGVLLGRGWFARNDYAWTGFGSPRALVRIHVEYTDGRTRTVTSDGTWRAAASPITDNDVYDGETYDARREEPGWATPGFDDPDWADAAVVAGPSGTLRPERVEPVRRARTFDPATVEGRDDGILVDFGQNFAGRIELVVDDPEPGQEIVLAHAEALTDDGALSTADLRSADATDVYVARGDDRETYEPHFTYHGFRYARITGAAPDALQVVAHAYHTDVADVGSVSCSDETLHAIHHATEWSLRSNAVGLPTGCAQRDERTGWTGDARLSAPAMLYTFDAVRFYEKWLRDHADDATDRGCLADVVPHVQGGKPGGPSWTVTRVVLPWTVYRFTGDPAVLREHYAGMRRYVDYWHGHLEDGILPAAHGNYGDWLALEGTRTDAPVGEPLALFNTASHYRVTDTFATIAGVLGNDADASRYRERALTVRDAFNESFLSPNDIYGPGTQAAAAVPLEYGMVPDDRRAAVIDELVAAVRSAGEELRTGFLGTRALLFALADHGHADLAYEVVTGADRPGWGYMVEQGATTLWERWDSDDRVDSGMNSFNHHQFAYVSEWFAAAIAGLRPAGADEAGRLRFDIEPTFVDALAHAGWERETTHGRVLARWDRTDDGHAVSITVPWNATATLRLPLEPDAPSWSADGTPLEGTGSEATWPAGVAGVEPDGGTLRVQLFAGEYEFRSTS
jgi:alpha-L-rhamnosidase